MKTTDRICRAMSKEREAALFDKHDLSSDVAVSLIPTRPCNVIELRRRMNHKENKRTDACVEHSRFVVIGLYETGQISTRRNWSEREGKQAPLPMCVHSSANRQSRSLHPTGAHQQEVRRFAHLFWQLCHQGRWQGKMWLTNSFLNARFLVSINNAIYGRVLRMSSDVSRWRSDDNHEDVWRKCAQPRNRLRLLKIHRRWLKNPSK